MLKVLTFHFNPFEVNCYVAGDETGECAIIDPGFYTAGEAEALYSKIAEKGLTPKMIVLTHAHPDHIYGAKECAEKYGIPVYMSPEDDYLLKDDYGRRHRTGRRLPESVPVWI